MAGAELRVVALDRSTHPTADFTESPAMDEAEFLDAVSSGYDALSPEADLVVLGEMGIGNTTAAAAVSAALFGGGGGALPVMAPASTMPGLKRKRDVIDRALTRHARCARTILCVLLLRSADASLPPFSARASPRARRVFRRCSMASSALRRWRRSAKLHAGALDHVLAGHLSAESGHRLLLQELGLRPLLDLGMRLGEGSGAAVAVLVLRAALACHTGMATFAEAQVSDKRG